MPRFAETIWLRRASQINDRQVLPTAMIAHIKANGRATVASDRCVRRGAGRAARPSRARFVSRPLTRRQHIMIENLMRCFAIERRMRATMIIPNRKTRYLLVERVRAQWRQCRRRPTRGRTRWHSGLVRSRGVPPTERSPASPWEDGSVVAGVSQTS